MKLFLSSVFMYQQKVADTPTGTGINHWGHLNTERMKTHWLRPRVLEFSLNYTVEEGKEKHKKATKAIISR